MYFKETIVSAFLLVTVILTSCGNKEEWIPSTGEKVDLTLSIVSYSPSTKTTLEDDGSNTFVRWTASDKLHVIFDSWEDGNAPLFSMSNSSSNTETGKFEGMVRGIPDGSHNVYAFASNSGFVLKADRKILLNVPDIQAPVNGAFDPAADIVASHRYHLVVKADEDHVQINDMRFYRLLSTVMVSATNKTSKDLSGERIKKITLESDAPGIALAGSILYDFDAESSSTVSAISIITATLSSPLEIGSEDKAYLLFAPVTLPKGSTLVATLETEHYRIIKTVSLPQDMPFNANKMSSLSLNLKDSDTVIDKL